MHTVQDTCGADVLSRLVIQVEQLTAQQAELTELVRSLVKQSRGEAKRSTLYDAIQLLGTIGPNTAAIARQLGIPRKTLDSWPEFKRARDTMKGFASLEARDRASGFTDVDPDADGE
ncbi:MAG: hypothetical protein E6R03_12355 [Hyphomicrobiaceae bacterium]|nr:MAG: hypothetical protein E6R03_12355 [Hyphomicrobiaceae bacterium]